MTIFLNNEVSKRLHLVIIMYYLPFICFRKSNGQSVSCCASGTIVCVYIIVGGVCVVAELIVHRLCYVSYISRMV